ncbi:hypothetical protein GCM10027449_00180 [Sinomonas notoginsengisoli]
MFAEAVDNCGKLWGASQNSLLICGNEVDKLWIKKICPQEQSTAPSGPVWQTDVFSFIYGAFV